MIHRLAQFGKKPHGERLDRIKRSPNYTDGAFRNLSPTPMFTGDGNMFTMGLKFLLQRQSKRRVPHAPLPHLTTSLIDLDPQSDVLIWFGHSSYFMQIDGCTVLVDPVLSGHASPFPFVMKAFPGSDVYKVEMIPKIDLLVITHDHWDHLDHKTVTNLKDRIDRVVCPLGVGAHLEHWGFAPEKIIELDWWEGTKGTLPDHRWSLHATPARHFSGRGLTRNRTLWSSFVLSTSSLKIYIGGDSGFDTHFADIGNRYGPFDLAVLELGQYDNNWKYIHMLPVHFMQAAHDLQAQRVLPVHHSKFALAQHDWDDPLKLFTQPSVTPRIGEVVNLRDANQTFDRWW